MTLLIVFGLVYVAGALTATVLLLWLEIRPAFRRPGIRRTW